MAIHDLSIFYNAAHDVLSGIAKRNNINGDIVIQKFSPTTHEEFLNSVNVGSIKFMGLKWHTEESVVRKIHVELTATTLEAGANVSIHVWKDKERKRKDGRIRKFRQIFTDNIDTLRNIEKYNRAKAIQKLSAILRLAYTMANSIKIEDLYKEIENRVDYDDGDPGPIKLSRGLHN